VITGLVLGDRGETTYLLGLSFENLRQLGAGRPIFMTEHIHGLPPGVRIVIFAGTTEDSLMDLFPRIRDAVVIDRREKHGDSKDEETPG